MLMKRFTCIVVLDVVAKILLPPNKDTVRFEIDTVSPTCMWVSAKSLHRVIDAFAVPSPTRMCLAFTS